MRTATFRTMTYDEYLARLYAEPPGSVTEFKMGEPVYWSFAMKRWYRIGPCGPEVLDPQPPELEFAGG